MKVQTIISYVGVLAIGIGIGYFLSYSSQPDPITKIVNKVTVDTLVKPEIIEVPVKVETKVREVDTVYINSDTIGVSIQDSLGIMELVDNDTFKVDPDTIPDEIILRDKRIDKVSLDLIHLSADKTDTLLESLLDVKTIKQSKISVEFWESPVNYTGYKLSKSSLIIYGLLPSENAKLYKFEANYYFQLDGLYYQLIETSTYLNYTPINKPEIIND